MILHNILNKFFLINNKYLVNGIYIYINLLYKKEENIIKI
jgi:hypothetical protein